MLSAFRRCAFCFCSAFLLLAGCASSDSTLGLDAARLSSVGEPQVCPCAYVTNPGNNSVTVYAMGIARSDLRPIQTISGSKTGLYGPRSIAVDASRNIYVANPAGAIVTVYAAGATGNVSPIATLSGYSIAVPGGIAVDSEGDIYVLNYDSISEYAPNASGSVTPIRTIAGRHTKLTHNSGFAMDADGNFYVDHYFLKGRITEYASNASGDVNPIRIIGGKKTGLGESGSLTVDKSGNIYVVAGCCYSQGSVEVFAAGAKGDAKPIRTIAGPKTMLDTPTGVALDSNENLYVSNFSSSVITVYAPGAKGNVSPERTIVGSQTGLDYPGDIAIWPPG